VKYEHIETMCEQLGVPLAEIQKYNREHKSEIERIKDIFTLKGDYKEKYLALLYLFSDGDEDYIKRYRGQAGLDTAEYDSANLLEQHKVFLITALLYNDDFYAMAVNDIGFASVGIDIKGAGSSSLLSVVQPEERNRRGNVIGFPKSRPGAAEERIAASPKDNDGSLE
jgi:hypothetical protein